MKVVHVIPFLWSGAGKVLTELCVSQRLLHDVTVISSGESKGMSDWPEYRQRLQENGIRHRCIDFFDRDPAVFWNSVRQLTEICADTDPDVVHCHSGVPACAAGAVRDASDADFRLVGQLHSWGTSRPDWMNTMDIAGFVRSDLVIANAAAYRRILIEGGVPAEKVVSIPWGVDPEALEVMHSPGAPGGRIGFVGRIEPRKGQLDLVRAFDCLHSSRPELRLELAGPVADEAYEHEIESFIEARNLSNNIWLGGPVPDVYQRESNWDLFVSLSSDEGQGMAILEAMAIGVPVLARSCPGVQDYLQDGKNAIALKSSAAKDVAGAIDWALDHPEETTKLSEEARKMVQDAFTWDHTVMAMETVYGIHEAY